MEDEFEKQLKEFLAAKFGPDKVKIHKVEINKENKNKNPFEKIAGSMVDKVFDMMMKTATTLLKDCISAKEGELIEFEIAKRKIVLRVVEAAE